MLQVRNGFGGGAEGALLQEAGAHEVPFSGQGAGLASVQADQNDRGDSVRERMVFYQLKCSFYL